MELVKSESSSESDQISQSDIYQLYYYGGFDYYKI